MALTLPPTVPDPRLLSAEEFEIAVAAYLSWISTNTTEMNATVTDIDVKHAAVIAAQATVTSLGASLPLAQSLVASIVGASVVATYVNYADRSSDTALIAADRARVINCTAAFTQTLTAAATLGVGWFCYVQNSSTGRVVIDPNASETINGAATLNLSPGQLWLLQCAGTGFNASLIRGNEKQAKRAARRAKINFYGG